MSTEENKAVIRRLITAFEKHDLDAVWVNFDPQCRFPILTRFGIEPTFENYRRFIASFSEALPDVHHTIEEMVAEEEKVWVNYTIRGTHEGLLRNVPATHKQISYSLMAMYRVAHGKVVEADFQSDDLSLLRQLDALPS
jgi:steroid delta-isomerase-like uncharacterized protein